MRHCTGPTSDRTKSARSTWTNSWLKRRSASKPERSSWKVRPCAASVKPIGTDADSLSVIALVVFACAEGDNMKKTLAPIYRSFLEYLDRWDEHAERMAKCDAAAKKASRKRLMSSRPKHRLSHDDLWRVIVAYRGRCVYCRSLAVERRPSNPDGSPAVWEHIARRIGSFEHVRPRFRGGDDDLPNIACACLWCNTHPSERREGATDHGGFHPPPDDPADSEFEVYAIAEAQALAEKYDMPLDLLRYRVSPFRKKRSASFAPVGGRGDE
jgi:hypothetical protein